MSSKKQSVDIITLCRYAGNFCGLFGYLILLHYDPLLGSSIKLIGLGLLIPFCFQAKLWDVLILFGFFGILDITNVIKLLS